MAPHSSTLAWKISWTEEPGKLRSMGSLRVAQDWATSLYLFTFMHWRRKWQSTPVFLAWRIPGTREPGGLRPMGSHRVGHDWSDLAAVAAARRGIGGFPGEPVVGTPYFRWFHSCLETKITWYGHTHTQRRHCWLLECRLLASRTGSKYIFLV